MRLTADLINNSLSYINPLKERELDLRGHKIPAIENLGVAKDQDCLDLTDNDIPALANFPLSPRLRTLLLARNRVAALAPNLATQLPNLTTLVLTQNRLAELGDLEPLGGFEKLTHLVLVGNGVTGKENYRYWVLYLCPAVRFLDFQKVKQRERVKAAELFGTKEEPSELAKKLLTHKSRTTLDASASYTNGTSSAPRQDRVRLTDTEKKRVEELIRNAKSLKEIERLEKMLNEGRVPGGGGDTEMGGV